MAVQKIVLELVLVAAKASVARSITVLGARLQDLQRLLEDGQSDRPYPLGKASPSGKGIVNIDFRLASVTSFGCEVPVDTQPEVRSLPVLAGASRPS